MDLGGAGDYTEIQAAIDAADDGDEVLVSPGEYVIKAPISFLGKGITVKAQAGPGETTIRMSKQPADPDSASVVIFESGEDDSAVLDGFTLTGGQGIFEWDFLSYSGGGVYCYWSSPTLTNCVIRGNSADCGGGVYCLDLADPTIANCTISGNRAGEAGFPGAGGGVYCDWDSWPVLTDCTISGNSGSGMYCSEGTSPTVETCTISGNSGSGVDCTQDSYPTLVGCTISGNLGSGVRCSENSCPSLTDCTISGNWAEQDGGGVYCEGDSFPTLTSCAISGNSASGAGLGAGTGGGIYCGGGSTPTMTDCTISGNSARRGGGVYCGENASPGMPNCTIAGNSVSGSGGGVYLAGDSSPTLINCIVWDNAGGSLEVEEGATPTVTYSSIESEEVWSGDGNINQDPLFCGWGVASEVYVDSSNPEPGDGSQENPYRDLETAFDYSLKLSTQSPCIGSGQGGVNMGADRGVGGSPGEEARLIHLAPGTYALRGLSLHHRLSIQGSGEKNTILEGTVWGLRSGAFLSQLTVTGATWGGIVVSQAEAPEITECTISGNSAEYGGGVACLGSSSPTFTDCTISGNYQQSSCFKPIGCIGAGAGVYCSDNSSPTLASCTISGNSAEAGGGLYCGGDSSATLIDCTVSENSAETGGGLYCGGQSSLTATNCTISGNDAEIGGGLYCGSADSPILTNCIVWDNIGGSISAEEGFLAQVIYSCIEGDEVWPGEGNLNEDPLFCRWGEAGEVYVDAANPESGDGTQGNPLSSLAQALEYSLGLLLESPCRGAGQGGVDMGAPLGVCDVAGDTRLIHLAPGTYSIAGLDLSHNVSIDGAGEDETVIEGTVRGLRTGATLSHVTITGGTEDGIVVDAGQAPEIRNCTVTGNPGYGIFCSDSSPTVDNCTISGNSDSGVYCLDSSPTIIDCTISGNSARVKCWAIACWGGDGGGVYCTSMSSPALTNCTISGNVAGLGGGVYCTELSSPTLTNCRITDNSGDHGGGVYCSWSSSPALTNCTISGNLARSGGGGMYCNQDSSPTLANCIVWGNAGGSIQPEWASLQVTHSCLDGDEVWPGEGNINEDPLFCGWGGAREIYVDGANPEPGDGTQGNPFSGIEPALDYSSYSLALSLGSPCLGAGEGGVDMGAATGVCETAGEKTRLVHLAPGTYSVVELNLSHGVAIQGAGEGQTVIEGTVWNLRTEATLSHLTVIGGTAGGIVVHGGQSPEITDCTISGSLGDGVSCSNSFPTLRNCLITENSGNGISCSSGSPTLADCTISGNSGSGMYCWGGSSPTVDTCTISGNSGSGVACYEGSSPTLTGCTLFGNTGRGISCSNSSPTLNNCTVSGNSAGGMSCSGSAPTLTGCTISRNTADHGGGIYCSEDSSPIITNCAILENEANEGGGVYSWKSSPTLANCTIWGNSVRIQDPQGGGLYSADSSPTLTNCIVWGNAGGSIWIEVISFPNITYSCLEGEEVWPGEGNINDDPLFCGWGDAGEVFVDAANPGPGDGTQEDPFSSLEQAFDYSLALSLESPCRGAGEGGVDMGTPTEACDAAGERTRLVHLAQGTYGMADLHMFHGISMEGAGEGETVIEGAVWGLRTGATLSHLTVTGGEVFVSDGEAPEISNCALSGGVSCSGTSSPRFTACTISGVSCSGTSSPTLTDCTLSGVSCSGDSSPAIAECTIKGVSCSDNSFPTLTTCTISGNSGSGVSCDGSSSPILANCMISGNRASIVGGGLECSGDSSPSLINCTITGNVVRPMCVWFLCIGGEGGGVYCNDNASPTLTNCIVWDNVSESIWVGGNANPLVAYSCIQGESVWPGQRNTNIDPLFVHPGQWIDTKGTPQDQTDDTWEEGDCHLRASSPVIDAGTSEGAPATDMEGRTRPCGEGIDMGAYESCGVLFRRGDADADGKIHLMDVMTTLVYIFGRGAELTCQKSADCDDSGKMALADALLILNYIFTPGAAPPAEPFSECGTDLTVDNLTCEFFAPCE